MIYIVAAHLGEVQFIIHEFALEAQADDIGLTIYQRSNLDLCVVLSGQGQVAVEQCARRLNTRLLASDYVINIGLAGGEGELGSWYRIAGVYYHLDHAVLSLADCAMSWCNDKLLCTVDSATQNYPSDALVDMELWHWKTALDEYNRGTQFAAFKCLSDTPDHPLMAQSLSTLRKLVHNASPPMLAFLHSSLNNFSSNGT